MSSTQEDVQALLELGLESADPELVQEALANGAVPDGTPGALHRAVYSGRPELVRLLLDAGARVAAELDEIDTSVHTAVERGEVEILQLLLAADGRVALNAFDVVDRTPLMLAVERGDLRMMEMLIQAGSDVNARNAPGGGGTALLHAAQEGSVEIVKLLLRAGADPRIPGFVGWTPFDRAERRRPEIRDELLELFRHAEKTRQKPVSHRKARRSYLHKPD